MSGLGWCRPGEGWLIDGLTWIAEGWGGVGWVRAEVRVGSVPSVLFVRRNSETISSRHLQLTPSFLAVLSSTSNSWESSQLAYQSKVLDAHGSSFVPAMCMCILLEIMPLCSDMWFGRSRPVRPNPRGTYLILFVLVGVEALQ